MDIILASIAFICIIVGLIGAVLPLPGPPLSFVGILLLHYTKYAEFSTTLLVSLGIVTAIVLVLDYYVPIWGTKKFGGSKWGSIGATIGLLIGMFLGSPFGIFIGAFVGAFVGELLAGSHQNAAFKAALGSFIGFVTGIVMKLALCIFMLVIAIKAVI